MLTAQQPDNNIVRVALQTAAAVMGGNGAVYATADEVWYAGPVKVQVGSTVGAGDSVVAAWLHPTARPSKQQFLCAT